MTATIGLSVGEARKGEEAGGRCLVWRKCATCGDKTDHAYLRDDPQEAWCRDTAELSPAQAAEQLRQRVLEESGWDMGPFRG